MSLATVFEALALNVGDSYESRQKDIESLESYRSVAGIKESNRVSSKIIANAPNDVNPDTVGEYLYGCAIEQTEAPTACVPSCVNSYSIDSIKCRYAVYKRSNHGTIKINKVQNGDIVYLYIPHKDSKDLSSDEIEIFRSCGFKKVVVYQYPDKGINYEYIDSYTIARDLIIRPSNKKSYRYHDDKKKTSKKSSKVESRNNNNSTKFPSGTSVNNGIKSDTDNIGPSRPRSDNNSSRSKHGRNSSRTRHPAKFSSTSKSDDDSTTSKSDDSDRTNSCIDPQQLNYIDIERLKPKNSSCSSSLRRNIFRFIVYIVALILIFLVSYIIYRSGWLFNAACKLEQLNIQPAAEL